MTYRTILPGQAGPRVFTERHCLLLNCPCFAFVRENPSVFSRGPWIHSSAVPSTATLVLGFQAWAATSALWQSFCCRESKERSSWSSFRVFWDYPLFTGFTVCKEAQKVTPQEHLFKIRKKNKKEKKLQLPSLEVGKPCWGRNDEEQSVLTHTYIWRCHHETQHFALNLLFKDLVKRKKKIKFQFRYVLIN